MRLNKVGAWEELKDPKSGSVFYYNHKTGISQWEAPPGFAPVAVQPPSTIYSDDDSDDEDLAVLGDLEELGL